MVLQSKNIEPTPKVRPENLTIGWSVFMWKNIVLDGNKRKRKNKYRCNELAAEPVYKGISNS